MEVIKYLLDSNAAIDYIGGILPSARIAWLDSIIDQNILISVINQIEILGFNPANPTDLIPFEELANTVTILPLSDNIVHQTITIRKLYKIKLPDAIIAATALVHGLYLITRNTTDFSKIPGLNLINPHDPL